MAAVHLHARAIEALRRTRRPAAGQCGEPLSLPGLDSWPTQLTLRAVRRLGSEEQSVHASAKSQQAQRQ